MFWFVLFCWTAEMTTNWLILPAKWNSGRRNTDYNISDMEAEIEFCDKA